MERLDNEEVDIHPNGTSPVVVTQSVVGVIFRQTPHSIVREHGRVLSHKLIVRRLELCVVNIQHIQEEWPEVQVTCMSIKLLVAVLVEVEFVENLSVCIPEVIKESLRVRCLLCSVMSFVVCLSEHMGRASQCS